MATLAELLCAASGLSSGTLEEHLCAAASRTGDGSGLQIVGVMQDTAAPLLGVVASGPALEGVIAMRSALLGAVRTAPQLAGTLTVERVVGFIPSCQCTEDDMADLELKRGDTTPIDFVIITDPVLVTAGSWTWDGSTTIAATVPGGVSTGQWVRMPASKSGEVTNPLFKVSAVGGSSITIENPTNEDIPSGSGIEAADPVDITNSTTKFTMRHGDDVVIQKFSYDSDEVEHTAPLAGELSVYLDKQDFRAADGSWLETGEFYTFDVENTRRGASITLPTGTLTVAASGDTLVTVDDAADLALLRIGDLVVPAGDPGNDVQFTVQENPTTKTTLSGQVETDYAGLVAQAAFAFTAFKGNTKTPICGTAAIRLDSTP